MSTSSDKICKDGASTIKSNNDGVCDVNNMLQKLSTVDEEDAVLSVCANCGKEGANNICNKCKQVKYCNAVCKKVHKKKHKKDCDEHLRLTAERRIEELRIAAELHDEMLFKQPPAAEDCPICFLRLPTLEEGRRYQSCCGKVICSGCVYAPVYDNQGNIVAEKKCPFCRTPPPTSDEEMIKREKKLIEKDNAIAIYDMGCNYLHGMGGRQQDYKKALKLFHRAADLGYAKAYSNIGYVYNYGKGVEVDEEKAIHYYELAAMGGDLTARYNLGATEQNSGNYDRALKHYMIAVRGGKRNSLETIQKMYKHGYATKEDYMKALKLYQEYLGEIKSPQRDKAAAARDKYRYY